MARRAQSPVVADAPALADRQSTGCSPRFPASRTPSSIPASLRKAPICYLEIMPFTAHLGVFPLPVAGESRDASPSVDDIARVAVAALRKERKGQPALESH